jgi:hypothetical protein
MLEFIVFDKTTNRGTYWLYGWRDGEAGALKMILNAQQITGVYQTTRGFEIGACRKDEDGNYVTSQNKKVRSIIPRL